MNCKKNRLLFLLFVSTIWISPVNKLAAQVQWQLSKNCDLPAASLASLKKSTVDECQKTCEDHKNCAAFVFVSGWQRCFLKESAARQARIQLLSGELSSEANRAFDKKDIKVDFDHTGKDLERIVLDKVEDCAKACLARSDCYAFTYIDGYRVCWLKAGGGKFQEKIFQCGVKSP